MRKILTPNRIYPLILILLVFIVWKIRENKGLQLVELSGTTMGPIVYNIKYLDKDARDFKNEIDSLLKQFNRSLNTYDPDSEISQFNKNSVFQFDLPYFLPVLKESVSVHKATEGAFDPTVMPLVNAWGFGPEQTEMPDSSEVDSLKGFVDYDYIQFNEDQVWKLKHGVALDFSAIAKGYAVDVIAEYLKEKGIDNYFVDIGGEIICHGKNQKGDWWTVGIIDPLGDIFNRSIYAKVGLENKAIATSANNYNYIIKDGQRYVHTLDPSTGYPIEHNLLSASVFATKCITADAFATGFMVMGLDKAVSIIEGHEELEGLLIYSDKNGQLRSYSSGGISPEIVSEQTQN